MPFTYPALFQSIHEGGYKGGYFVKFPDLPGCATQAHNLDHAHAYVIEAITGWIEVGFECGDLLNRPSNPSTLACEDGFMEMVTSDQC